MRRFELHSLKGDEDGSSERAAEGVEFTDGACVVRWDTRSTFVYDGLADVETDHGRDGKTHVVWVDTQYETLVGQDVT